jgi:hypothetical protein
MFEDIRKTTTKLFDDEKANIREIRTDVKQIYELKNEISKLVNALNERTRKIENISGSSPTPYEIPKYLKYLIIAFLSLGIISFIAYLSFLIKS